MATQKPCFLGLTQSQQASEIWCQLGFVRTALEAIQAKLSEDCAGSPVNVAICDGDVGIAESSSTFSPWIEIVTNTTVNFSGFFSLSVGADSANAGNITVNGVPIKPGVTVTFAGPEGWRSGASVIVTCPAGHSAIVVSST